MQVAVSFWASVNPSLFRSAPQVSAMRLTGKAAVTKQIRTRIAVSFFISALHLSR